MIVDGDDGEADGFGEDSDDDDDELERIFQASRPARAHGEQQDDMNMVGGRVVLTKLGSFPDECLLAVMMRIQCPRAVSMTAAVCKRFYTISRTERLWEFLFDDRFGNVDECRPNEHPLSVGLPQREGGWKDLVKRWAGVEKNWKTGATSVRSLEGHSGGVCSCQLKAGTLVTAGEDATVKWWDVDTLNCVWSEAKAHKGPIWCIKVEGDRVVTSSSDGSVKLWQFSADCADTLLSSPMQCARTFRGHLKGEVWCCDIDARNNNVFSGGRDGTCQVFDIETGANYLSLKKHTDSVFSLKAGGGLSREADEGFGVPNMVHTVLSGSGDCNFCVWDLRCAKSPCLQVPHEQPVFCTDCVPDQGLILTGCGDGKLRRFDLRAGKCRAALEGHRDSVWDLAYNSLARRVVTASVDRTVRIWDLLAERCDVVLECHLEPTMAVQADALRVVSGDSAGWMFMWDFGAEELKRGDCEYESLMSYVGPVCDV